MADPLDEMELLPASLGDGADSSAALDAAEAALLEDPASIPVAEDPPIPFGKTWHFDHRAGRFLRVGGAPAPVRGEQALYEWLQALIRTAAGAHPIFANFGIEDPEDFLGRVDPAEAFADFEDRLRDGAIEHDRIEDVRDLDADILQEDGLIRINSVTIVTDDPEYLRIGDVLLPPEV
jgi:hypothetical protein